jgi:hypothetical protein
LPKKSERKTRRLVPFLALARKTRAPLPAVDRRRPGRPAAPSLLVDGHVLHSGVLDLEETEARPVIQGHPPRVRFLLLRAVNDPRPRFQGEYVQRVRRLGGTRTLIANWDKSGSVRIGLLRRGIIVSFLLPGISPTGFED